MDQKLGLTEYEEVLFDNISKVVINRNYLNENRKFWDYTVFKLFEAYYYSLEPISIRKQAEMLEIFFDSMFKNQPSTEKPEDVITF